MLEKELQSRTPMGVIGILQETGSLPMQYHPHKLSGKFEGLWECHIKSDWLLIWQQNDTELVLIMTDTGTCLLYTSPSPRDKRQSRMPSSA